MRKIGGGFNKVTGLYASVCARYHFIREKSSKLEEHKHI